MNKFLAMAALAATFAAGAAEEAPAATPPAPAASAAADPCTRVEVRTVMVNGKAVEVRKKRAVAGCKPQATRLWD